MKKRMLTLSILAMLLTITVLTAVHTTVMAKNDWQNEYLPYINEASEEYGICPELLMAIIETESSGDPNAMNGSCAGLMQIYTKYHWERLWKVSGDEYETIAGFFEPRLNIMLGADYLAELFEQYGDVALVLDIYNGNSKAFENYENGVMSDYAQRILERAEELERLHGK